MRKAIWCWLCLTMAAASGAVGATASLTVDQLFAVCDSRTIAAAVAHGDALQWTRLPDSRLAEWRRGFKNSNGGPVEVVGWQRTAAEADGLLSYWIASGRDGHRACAYTVKDPNGDLLAAFESRLGAPDDLSRMPPSTVASWKRGGMEIYYAQVGATVYVNISHKT